MTSFLRFFAAAAAFATSVSADAQFKELTPTVVKIWPNGAPGSEARRNEPEKAQDYWVRNVHDPSISIFQPDAARRTGTAVIILPGGGHQMLVWTGEGLAGARALNRMGITAITLKYRLAREEGSKYSVEGQSADDVRRAIRWVRAHAAEYRIDPHRIGVMGFSAGGELASLVSNYPPSAVATTKDDLSRVSARPDFQIQVFPGPAAVKGPISRNAPPAFLVAGSRDDCCAEPTVALYELLRKAGILAELHMYAEAGHAFNIDETDRISVLHWPDRLFDWLSDSGWLGARAAGK